MSKGTCLVAIGGKEHMQPDFTRPSILRPHLAAVESRLAPALQAVPGADERPATHLQLAFDLGTDDALRLEAGQPARSGRLTLREREILALIGKGLSNRAIGVRLSVSEKTVKNHISRMYVKLAVTSRTQAAVYAIRRGIA